MTDIPIFTVTAWSGTGKTTFLEKLIPLLKARGLRVAVLKHDAHRFEIDHAGKDSWRFTRAGSDMTLLASAEKAVVMENRPIELEDLLGYVHDVDLILTEGWKQGPWPKILLHRQALGKPPVLDPDVCFAVVSDVPLTSSVPSFALDDAAGVAELLCSAIGWDG